MIFVNKGIEIGTKALTLDIIVDSCGPKIAKAATFIVSETMLPICHLIVNSCSRDHRLRKKVSVIFLDENFKTHNYRQSFVGNQHQCPFVPCQRRLPQERHNYSISRGSDGVQLFVFAS